MEHLICRCKHCGTEYTYCTYGNNDNCTDEYCGECGTAIIEALKGIPQKYKGIKQLLTDSKEIEKAIKIFDEERTKYKESGNIKMSKVIGDWGYEVVEGCYIDKTEYYFCTDKNGRVDIYALKEFDIKNNNFTGKYFFENKNHRRQYFSITQMKFEKLKDIKVKPMKEPEGKLFYEDFNWDIIFPKNE